MVLALLAVVAMGAVGGGALSTATDHCFAAVSSSSDQPAVGNGTAADLQPMRKPAVTRPGCRPGEVGLLDFGADSPGWVSGSCITADWADDVLVASMLVPGVAVAYVTPADGDDTYLATVDFNTSSVTKAVVGGMQGELRCIRLGKGAKCYGVSPGDDSNPTQLIEVDAKTGDSKPVLNLKKFIGYSLDGSAINPDLMLYHAILAGKKHTDVGAPSNQWLVTIQLGAAKPTIVAEVPVGQSLMGPFSVSSQHGLATWGSDKFDGFVAVDYKTGRQTETVKAYFGTIVQYSGAYTRNSVFAVNVYPHPPRMFDIGLAGSAATVDVNATFTASVHALAALW